MQHSYSTQSFIKQPNLSKSPIYHKHSNDITTPKYISKHQLSQIEQTCSPRHHSVEKLNKKIRQIKSALKIAEQHNQELHNKLTDQKKIFIQDKKSLQNQVNKFRSLYQMLIQNYQTRSLELKQKTQQLKEAKKIIKKYNKQHAEQYHQKQISVCDHFIQSPKIKQKGSKTIQKSPKIRQKIPEYVQQLITQQQVSIEHLKHQNKLLKQEIILKSRKLAEYEIIFNSYQSEQVLNFPIQKINKQSRIQKQNKQLIDFNNKCSHLQEQLQMFMKQKQITSTKVKRLQVQLESIKHINQTIQKQDKRLKKQNQQLRIQFMISQKSINQLKINESETKWKNMYQQVNSKYQQINQKYLQLLRFSYQIQKDFQRELHTMAKQMTRRQIVKNSDKK